MEAKCWRDCCDEMTEARNKGASWIVMVLIAALIAGLFVTGVLPFPSLLVSMLLKW